MASFADFLGNTEVPGSRTPDVEPTDGNIQSAVLPSLKLKELDTPFKSEVLDENTMTYHFDIDRHMAILLSNLQTLQESKVLTDVTWTSHDGVQVALHSIMLAALSDVFLTLFSQPSLMQFQATAFSLPQTSSKVQQILVSFVYGHNPLKDESEWSEVLDTASSLGFEKIVNGQYEPAQLMKGLKALYDKKQLTYTTLHTSEGQVLVNGTLLGASSPAFFINKEDPTPSWTIPEEVMVQYLSQAATEALVEYIHTAQIIISKDNVKSLLFAAATKQYPSLTQACCHFLSQHVTQNDAVSTINYVRFIHHLSASRYRFLNDLEDFIFQFLTQNLGQMMEEEGELNEIQSGDDLVKLLCGADLTSLPSNYISQQLWGWYQCDPTHRHEGFLQAQTCLYLLKHTQHAATSISVINRSKRLDCFAQMNVDGRADYAQ